MVLETIAALLLGALVVWLILQPLYRPDAARPAFEEPEDPEETRRGIALVALKEIDFDRATGKLSDADYDLLKEKYTVEALQAIREEDAPRAVGDDVERLVEARVFLLEADPTAAAGAQLRCPRCGPRPEPDARYCSSCGATLFAGPRCAVCGEPLDPGGRFCSGCGAKVAA
jgi:hypothetical protein